MIVKKNSEDVSLVRIHMCDDDPDDQLLLQEALSEARLANSIDFTENGEELLQYLRREGDYAELKSKSLPGLILLDLNMPKKDGREALAEIKSDPDLRRIPVVVLTTSRAEEDILKTYDLGVNSFIVKPVTFESLVSAIKAVTNYWFHIVELPNIASN
ncbi:MAG: response regulator [Pseudomonadales bacterium]